MCRTTVYAETTGLRRDVVPGRKRDFVEVLPTLLTGTIPGVLGHDYLSYFLISSGVHLRDSPLLFGSQWEWTFSE